MEYEGTGIKARHYPCGDVDVIEIKGEITRHAETVFVDVFNSLLREGRRKFVLDLSSMTYVNSAGLGLLVTLIIRMFRDRASLAFAAPSQRLRNQFRITRLDDSVFIFPTVSDAVAALQNESLH